MKVSLTEDPPANVVVTIPDYPVVSVSATTDVPIVAVMETLPTTLAITAVPQPDLTVIGLPGQPGPPGPAGPAGPPGTSGGESYRFVQPTAQTIWVIDHPLSYPTIVVVDSNGNIVVPEISYPSGSQVILTFSAAIAGEAYLS
jgi:hypothetical protein